MCIKNLHNEVMLFLLLFHVVFTVNVNEIQDVVREHNPILYFVTHSLSLFCNRERKMGRQRWCPICQCHFCGDVIEHRRTTKHKVVFTITTFGRNLKEKMTHFKLKSCLGILSYNED